MVRQLGERQYVTPVSCGGWKPSLHFGQKVECMCCQSSTRRPRGLSVGDPVPQGLPTCGSCGPRFCLREVRVPSRCWMVALHPILVQRPVSAVCGAPRLTSGGGRVPGLRRSSCSDRCPAARLSPLFLVALLRVPACESQG